MKKKKQDDLPPNPFLLYGVIAGLGIYGLLFLLSPVFDGQGIRAQWFLQLALLPDETIAEWFDSPSDIFLLDRFVPLATALSILAMAGMLGWLALAALRVDRRLSILEQIFFAEVVGLNLVSTYTLAIGLAGGLHNRWWFLLPAVAVVAGFAVTLRRRRDAPSTADLPVNLESPRSELVWLNHHWLWLAAAFGVMILLGGLLPSNEFDVREYHLQGPKEFFAAGQIRFLPHNLYANMALGAQMHSLLGMVLLGDWWTGALVGKAIIALFSPLTALGLVAAGRRFFTPAAGILAAVIYLSIPEIARVSTIGYIEGVSACYYLAALYAVLLAWKDRETTFRLWLLAGYLAGAAVACKYPGLLFVVAPLGLCSLRWAFCWKKGPNFPPHAWRAPVVFSVAVLGGCGLWLAKNWVLAGNPTYPLLFGLFGGETWTPEKDAIWNSISRPHVFTLEALLADLRRVFVTSEYYSPLLVPLATLALLKFKKLPGNHGECLPRAGAARSDDSFRIGTNSTAPLRPISTRCSGASAAANTRCCAFSAKWRCPTKRRRLVLGLLGYFAFVIAAWWMVALRIDRYWVPALPLLALLAGVGATWSRSENYRRSLPLPPVGGVLRGFRIGSWNRDRVWQYALLAFLLAGCLGNALLITAPPCVYNRFFVPYDTLRVAPDRLNPWHRYLNENADGTVLLVGEAQVFDLEVPILYNVWLDDSIFEQIVRDPTSGDPTSGDLLPADAIRAELAARNVSHVYVAWGEIGRYIDSGYGTWDFVQPAVFHQLVAAGVLEPVVPPEGLEESANQTYKVVGEKR